MRGYSWQLLSVDWPNGFAKQCSEIVPRKHSLLISLRYCLFTGLASSHQQSIRRCTGTGAKDLQHIPTMPGSAGRYGKAAWCAGRVNKAVVYKSFVSSLQYIVITRCAVVEIPDTSGPLKTVIGIHWSTFTHWSAGRRDLFESQPRRLRCPVNCECAHTESAAVKGRSIDLRRRRLWSP